MENPLISVVMCTWNGQAYLREQIDSILKQTYHPIELIISDDASTDGTKQILKEYEAMPSVRIYYQEKNMGLSANFDFALSKAQGNFIAVSDQDDVWLEHKLQRLYDSIGDSMLIYSNSELVDENGNSLHRTTADIRKMYTGSDSRGYVMHSVVWGHGMLIRSELLKSSLPVPKDIHHDDWLAFMALTTGGIVYLDEVLTKYRQHTASTSKSIPVRQPRRDKKKRFEDYLKKKKWFELMRDHERAEMKPFYSKLVTLYSKKEKGGFVWPLFFFLLRHRAAIFKFSRKGFFSQITEIVKLSRGEKK